MRVPRRIKGVLRRGENNPPLEDWAREESGNESMKIEAFEWISHYFFREKFIFCTLSTLVNSEEMMKTYIFYVYYIYFF